MGFSRQEYWSGLLCSPIGIFLTEGLNLYLLFLLHWQVSFFTANATWEAHEVKLLSSVRLFVTPWAVAYQVPPSMGFSRQEYWSGLPFPSPGDLPHQGIKPRSPTL